MKTARCMLTALFMLAGCPAFAQVDVTGDWDVTIQSMQGTNTVRITFKQEGEKLSGIFKSRAGELPFEGGTLVGDDLTFGLTIPVQGQPIDIKMTGKVQGSSIDGKAQFGGFGEGAWTAKRVEPNSAATPSPAASASSAVVPAASVATGINGRWDVTVRTPMGEVPASAELVDTAGKISGTLTGPLGATDVAGTFEGNAIKLAFVAKTPQGDMPVSMTGELDGDSIINGKAEFGGMGQVEWSAKRKQ